VGHSHSVLGLGYHLLPLHRSAHSVLPACSPAFCTTVSCTCILDAVPPSGCSHLGGGLMHCCCPVSCISRLAVEGLLLLPAFIQIPPATHLFYWEAVHWSTTCCSTCTCSVHFTPPPALPACLLFCSTCLHFTYISGGCFIPHILPACIFCSFILPLLHSTLSLFLEFLPVLPTWNCISHSGAAVPTHRAFYLLGSLPLTTSVSFPGYHLPGLPGVRFW